WSSTASWRWMRTKLTLIRSSGLFSWSFSTSPARNRPLRGWKTWSLKRVQARYIERAAGDATGEPQDACLNRSPRPMARRHLFVFLRGPEDWNHEQEPGHCRIAGEGENDQEIPRQGLRGACLLWSRPRPRAEGRSRRSGRRFPHEIPGHREERDR